MPTSVAELSDQTSLRASAQELKRVAGDLQRHANDFVAGPASPATLAHLEEALDRMENALNIMAAAVTAPDADGRASSDAEALRWHLQETAGRLRSAGETCCAGRRWARRLLEAMDLEATPPDAAARTGPQHSVDRIPLCHVQDAHGQHTISALVDDVTLTYDVVKLCPDGELTRLREHVPTLRDARRWALEYAARVRSA